MLLRIMSYHINVGFALASLKGVNISMYIAIKRLAPLCVLVAGYFYGKGRPSIQSDWKGYLARKDSKGRLLDLRLKMQKSAANVDDSMHILNRLIAALSELLTMKSVSGILHTCDTLVSGRVRVAVRLRPRNAEELIDFAD